jgi:maltose alpha-D-glucosyltransferase/alpha-amylase
MAFHFPLMPRIFMALRLEDAEPIVDILRRTPPIPGTCQWGLFLRNHDELTLEMVTEDERDYMVLAYARDPQARLNVGIRRRLAPLVDNARRRIELLNGLLFSMPGTPIVYYGDEIGMGDDVLRKDRDGVRTPMQWSGGPSAGFSSAPPAALYSPPISDPVYGHASVNVESQLQDPSSLLRWMQNLIRLRKQFKVFGRGSLAFVPSSNRKVLAYLRRWGEDSVLCVANLSRHTQPATLDISDLAGATPIEMFGYTEFPPIGREPWFLSLGGYGFAWFELRERAAAAG